MDDPPLLGQYGHHQLDNSQAPFLSSASDQLFPSKIYVPVLPPYLQLAQCQPYPATKVLIPGRFAGEKPVWVNSKQAKRILVLR